jgi:hypothetical protein
MYQHQLELDGQVIKGTKYLEQVHAKLERLREVSRARDKAGNREFFFDHYVSLLLLYFFNPTLVSLRGLKKFTELDALRRRLKCPTVSLGALSEAGSVFDPEPLRELFLELGAQVPPARLKPEQAALRTLTAVDGSVLPALPRMVWALWQDDQHRAAKLHLHFEVARGIPVDASMTTAKDSEIEQLRQRLQAGRLYVLDRGYASYGLMADILTARASFILRVKHNTAFAVEQELPISPDARSAGVIRDVLVSRLGTPHHKRLIHQPLRLVEVQSDGSNLLLITDQLQLPAELVALGYRQRWTVELFFRWLKCVLGCRHWLGESLNALTIQLYVGLIASLLLTLWTQQKPNRRTFEMLCHFFSGWASEEELLRHLQQQAPSLKSGP